MKGSHLDKICFYSISLKSFNQGIDFSFQNAIISMDDISAIDVW